MIVADDLAYSFVAGTPVLAGISFSVSPGQIVAIVGPSGCGKTTLLRLISGYLQPTTGSVELDGGKAFASRQSIGVVYQDSRLIPWRNVAQNVQLPLEILKRPINNPLLDELLSLLRLTEHAGKYPAELSGGQQERSALARASFPRRVFCYWTSRLIVPTMFTGSKSKTIFTRQLRRIRSVAFW